MLLFFWFWGPRSKLRRYVSGLASLLGPAPASWLGLAFGHPYTALGRSSFWGAFSPLFQPFGPTASRGGEAAGLGMDRGGRRPDRGGKAAAGPSKPASPGTARPEGP